MITTNKTEISNVDINLTKYRGDIKFQNIHCVGKSGGEYFLIKATFEDGTTMLIDMQLIQLLNVKMSQAIRKSVDKDDYKSDLIEEIAELVSDSVIRDTILKTILD